MIKISLIDQTHKKRFFMKDIKKIDTVIADAPVLSDLNTTNFYQELLNGEGGQLNALGSTMKVAFELFQAKDSIELKSTGFVDNADLNEDTLNWIKDKGIDYINAGYREIEKAKKDLIVDYDNFKKDRPQLLRVLRDALPVACFLIDSDSPVEYDGSFFSEIKENRPLMLQLKPSKLSLKKDMNDRFNKDGSRIIDSTFNDLQKMTSFWFFNKEKDTIKTSIETANDKFIKSMDSLNKEGKIVETKQGQIDDTIKSCLKVITKQLDIIDTHERGDIITKVVEHIQQLTWFNNHCLPKQDIKLFGLVHKDAIKINAVENQKLTGFKNKLQQQAKTIVALKQQANNK